ELVHQSGSRSCDALDDSAGRVGCRAGARAADGRLAGTVGRRDPPRHGPRRQLGAVRPRSRPLARGGRQLVDYAGRRGMAGLRHEAQRRQTHDQWWGSRQAGDAASRGSADGASGYADDSRSARTESAGMVGAGVGARHAAPLPHFNSLTAANRQPTSFFSNRIANRRRSMRGAPPRAGMYSNTALTLPFAVLPRTVKSSIVNLAVIWFQSRKNASQPRRSESVRPGYNTRMLEMRRLASARPRSLSSTSIAARASGGW